MADCVEKSFGRRPMAPIARHTVASSPRGTSTANALRQTIFKAPHQNRFAGLDLLRLFAALAVVLFHFGYAGAGRGTMQTSFPVLAGPAQYGFLGVELFFLISGFVISASAQGRTWREFALSRFLRLYPAYVACMTVTALVLLLLANGSPPVSAQLWLANLTMLAPALGQPFMDGAYWSIVIEIIFYGWVAVLVAAGIFERRLMTILAVWLALAFLNECFFQSRTIRLALCTEYAALFVSGILFQRIMSGERRNIAWLLLGFAFGLGAMHAFETERIFARLYGDTISLPVLFVFHAGIYGLFLTALAASRWIPASRTILAIGALTYPLYLVHQQAGYLLIDTLSATTGAAPALALTVALLIAFAHVVATWVEPAARRTLRPMLDHLATVGLANSTRPARSR